MTTVRERIEARWHTDDTRPAHGSGGTVYVALEEALRAEWKAGNLIPRDEADARIEAAVAEAVAREHVPVEASIEPDSDGTVQFVFYDRSGRVVASAGILPDGTACAHILHGTQMIAQETMTADEIKDVIAAIRSGEER